MLGLVWWGSWRVFLETAFSHRFASAAAPLLLPSRTRLAIPGSVNSFQMLSKIKDHDTRIFKSSSLFTCTLYLLNTLDFFSLYFIAQWHSWAILLSNFCVYPSYFVKFLPSFLSLPRPPWLGSWYFMSFLMTYWVPQWEGSSLRVFSVCLSMVKRRLSPGCLQQLCKYSWEAPSRQGQLWVIFLSLMCFGMLLWEPPQCTFHVHV